MASPAPEAHSDSASISKWAMPLAVGATALAGMVILAPTILPLLGFSGDMAIEATTAMHVSGTSAGTGLAGAINSGIQAIPVIGPKLAEGGLFTAAASAGIGIGGMMLGNYISKKETGERKISLGKVIKYASLLTSALLALPSIITGISIGIVYLCGALGDNELASSAVSNLYHTLGSSHKVGAGIGAAGALAGISHLLSCGAGIVPAALGLGLFSSERKQDPKPTATPEVPSSPEPHNNRFYTDGSVRLEMASDAPLMAGKPAEIRMRLTDMRTGTPLSPDKLDTVHTQKVHLYLADQGLKDYHHIHPEPTETPGEYRFSFTPNTPNDYHAWSDITLASDHRPHKLRAKLASALERPVQAYIYRNNEDRHGRLTFNWQASEPLRKDAPVIVEVHVTDALGKPVTDLEPVLGAYAHLVGLSADGKSIIHTHPLDSEPNSEQSRGGPRLRFKLEPDFSGGAQFFLQVRQGGQDQFASFGQQVYPAVQNHRDIAEKSSGQAASCHRS